MTWLASPLRSYTEGQKDLTRGVMGWKTLAGAERTGGYNFYHALLVTHMVAVSVAPWGSIAH